MAKGLWGTSARVSTVLIGFALPAAMALARDLPGIDALAAKTPMPAAMKSAPLRAALAKAGMFHTESRLDVPTFVWGEQADKVIGTAKARASKAALDPTAAARMHLMELGDLYKLSPAEVNSLPVHHVQALENGASIVRFRNVIDGVEVFREEANVLLDGQRNLVSLSGYVMGDPLGKKAGLKSNRMSRAAAAGRTPQMAIAAALADYGFNAGVTEQLQLAESRDGYDYYALPEGATSDDGARLTDLVRIKKVLFRLPGGLTPAYYIEVQARDAGAESSKDAYAYVVAESNGAKLFRNNQTADLAFSYRVFAEAGTGLPLPSPTGRSTFPHPTGVKGTTEYSSFVTPNLITLQNIPFSRNDPWLAPAAKQTEGNNVTAYADLFKENGLTSVEASECDVTAVPAKDFRACLSSAATFDYTFDVTKNATANKTQSMASVTNLFYMNNFLHDWYYDAGFDEAAGNAQVSNYGRGGVEGDSIWAEGQDYGGVNNANMYTPADGGRPRMQMYLWPKFKSDVTISAPAGAAGTYRTGTSALGVQAFSISGKIVATEPALGCKGTLTNAGALTGNIAYVDRGTCTFAEKTQTAQDAGAIAVIFGNNQGGDTVLNFGVPDASTASITIGGVLVSQNNATKLKANMTGLTGTIMRGTDITRDGTLDNGIIAHEWGHYISNRLVGNASGLSTNQARGMGEGWADFHAMLLLVKESDALLAGNPNFTGAYPMDGYLVSGAAEELTGIRRFPYSSDLAKNGLTFKHIADGTRLPDGSAGTSNSEVHNTGEVWASMLWQCYSNMLRDTSRLSFTEAQRRMKNYLVAGYKLTPVAPTIVEARDALLAAIKAQDSADYALCYQGFATRGAGASAAAPDRYSLDNTGVLESFSTSGMVFASVKLAVVDQSKYSTGDGDGILDNGEGATLTLAMTNTGVSTLAATTATATSGNPHIGFPNGATVSFPSAAPGQTVTTTLEVNLNGAAGREAVALTVALNDPTVAYPPKKGVLEFAASYDEIPYASASDDVESRNSAWVAGNDLGVVTPDNSGGRVAYSPVDNRLLVVNPASAYQAWLQSPPLDIAATTDAKRPSAPINVADVGNFGFTFRHRYYFENDTDAYGEDGYFDGGLIEITTDGGATWKPIPASALSPSYNGAITTISDNPRAGEPAFVGYIGSYDQETVTVDLGSAYNGQTVQIRFVSAGDSYVAVYGWEIDDISFYNITNTPFDATIGQGSAPAPKGK